MKDVVKNAESIKLNPHFEPAIFLPGKTPESIITERAWTLQLLRLSPSKKDPNNNPCRFKNAWTISNLDDVDSLPIMLEALWSAHVASNSCGKRPSSFKWAEIRARRSASKFQRVRDAYLAAIGIAESPSESPLLK